jgi:mono/diheme cytochrome c family protein
MKRFAKWGGIVLGVIVLAATGLVGWVQVTWSADHPDTPLPAIAATDDPETIARGEYIVQAVAHCSTCHQPAEYTDARRLVPGAPLEGGYTILAGPFGTFTAANITPHADGIGGMTDGEIARVVRHGVNRSGRLSPVMHLAVGPMSDEDLTAVVSWLRAQEPVAGRRVDSKFGILGKALAGRFEPRMDAAPAHVPAGGISVERGRYLADGPAMCAGCHTPTDPMAGFAPTGPAYSGGVPEADAVNAGFEITAPNLTPDPRTGHIARWTEDQFVARFASGRVIDGSIMPWEAFGLMTEEDVRSIYRYLRTIAPVERETGPTHRRKGSFKG